MRIAAVAVLACVLATAASAGTRDPREPRQLHTAADTTQAKSIALALSDLPAGWVKAAPPKPAPPCTSEPDESNLVQTARIDPTFLWRDHITELGTEVDTFRTVSQAKRDWRLSTLAVVRRCLFQAIRRDLKDVTIKVLSAQRLPSPRLGERSVHYRLVFELRGKSKVLPVVVEMIGVGVGRTSVVLHALSPGGPLPAAALRALSAKVAKRLVDASGGI